MKKVALKIFNIDLSNYIFLLSVQKELLLEHDQSITSNKLIINDGSEWILSLCVENDNIKVTVNLVTNNDDPSKEYLVTVHLRNNKYRQR